MTVMKVNHGNLYCFYFVTSLSFLPWGGRCYENLVGKNCLLKPGQNKKGQKIFQLHRFLNTFLQLAAEKKYSKNGAAGNYFGPSYFVTALVIIWISAYFHCFFSFCSWFKRHLDLNQFKMVLPKNIRKIIRIMFCVLHQYVQKFMYIIIFKFKKWIS